MKLAVRFAAFFLVVLGLATAALADPYRVKDLVIDKVGPTAADAQVQGRQEALVVGARRLLERLTLPEDRAAARTPLDISAIARLSKSYLTQGEQKSSAVAGGIRVTGLITWTFRDADVRAYLESRGVPYVDSQAATALIVPVAAAGVDPAAWAGQWSTRAAGSAAGLVRKSDDTLLTPYVGSLQAWNRRPSADEVAAEVASAGAQRAVIAEAFMQGAQSYVRLVDMRTNAELGVAGPFVGLDAAQAGAVDALERAWKVSSIVRTSGSTGAALTASFSDIRQWVQIRTALAASRLISNLRIEAVTTTGADVSFSFAGRPEQLVADLRARGVDLATGAEGWVLTAAGGR